MLPTVTFPVLSPGYPLARNTAAIEAATARHFQPGQGPHGKRSRSADALAATPPTILDTLDAEEGSHGSSSGGGSALVERRASVGPMPPAAHTRSYLTKLFQEPARREQDVYRRVDVVQCRRELRAEEEVVVKSQSQGGVSTAASPAAVRCVRDFNSCLTMGQHHRYRTLVVEWLRHQPSRSAPPDSGEVLKVVQQEQRLFLTVLRQEALSLHAAKFVSLYEWLSPALVSFAKQWRIVRMRRQLLSFLDDAKFHTRELLTCCSPGGTNRATAAGEGVDGAAVDADYSGVAFERDEATAEANASGGSGGGHSFEPTPQQLHNRRHPSLRVFQSHMSQLYNALQNGFVASFPNPQVQSVGSCGPAAAAQSGVASPSALGPSALPRTTPSHLSLKALPTTEDNAREDQEREAAGSEEEGEGSNAASDEDQAEGKESSFAAHHVPLDAATPIAVAELRAYVEQHLLRRFGWRPSRQQHQQGDGAAAAEDVVESISLSITTAALLKLFVAHVDLEEPRTSFRLPLRVQLSPLGEGRGSGSDGTTAATGAPRYRAHVMVGDVIPNVKESRHSVQRAAAEYLLRQHYAPPSTAINAGAAAQHPAKSRSGEEALMEGGATAGQPTPAAQVRLSRSGGLQSTVTPGQVSDGSLLTAATANLLSVKEATLDATPLLSFHVVTPTPPTAESTQSDASSDAGAAHIEFVLAKMEHLDQTTAGAAVGEQSGVAHLQTSETALRCPFLLECLSPREMLQLDLLFGCFPTAVVRLHRVQLTASVAEAAVSTSSTADATADVCADASEAEADMQVLAVETLTCARWAHLRAQLLHRPAESFLAAPAPAEVLATQSWDLLYDTLAWLLDAVERHATDALRAALSSADPNEERSDEGWSDSEGHGAVKAGGNRFLYFILSNHANLVNTTARAKLVAKSGRTGANAADAAGRGFTESRFAVFYVLQDASELYPDYEPRMEVAFEASTLRFLEDEGGEGESNDNDLEGEEGEGAEGRERKGKDKGKVAARLYRDPHTWNADTIPFTFRRAAVVAEASSSAPRI